MFSKCPLISIVITNYNGIRFIERCLRSVFSSDYRDFEVILVDDCSTDGSLQLAKKNFSYDPRLKFIISNKSYGPAYQRSVGARHAKGKYIVFLDNDTKVEPNWLTEIIRVMESDPTIAVAQSKLLLMGHQQDRNIINTCGHYLGPFGFVFEEGYGEEDRGQYDDVHEIFGAKSPAMIVRRHILDEVGLFDPTHFIYHEETDLCWRVWLRGYRIVFIPSSVVYHAVGGSTTSRPSCFVMYHGAKNSIQTLIKNLGTKNLFKILPLHVCCWFGIALLLFLKRKPLNALSVIRGFFWVTKNLGQVLKKRMVIQQYIRKMPDSSIMPIIMITRRKDLYHKGLRWIKNL